jgi:vacuolar protein sorting-associated protein 13A/C
VAEKQEDTFTEKLITQIIKNVQIRIKCIHIRYEDAVTKPNSPFGCGIILKSLHVETTDTDWVPKIITESVDTVNKV